MNRVLKYSIVGLGLCLVFYLDFVRDYIFKNIGFQIYYLQHLSTDGVSSIENYTDSLMETYIADLSIKELNNLKWFFTAAFSLTFGIVGAAINGFFYQTRTVAYYFFILYILLFFGAFLIYMSSYLSSSYSFQNKAYLIAMEISHFLQSSLPSLFFLVSFKLFNMNKK